MKTKPLFEVKPIDRAFYENRLRNWLPERIIDIHAHLWLKRFKENKRPGAPVRTVSWPDLVADENPAEHLAETYRLMFPGKTVIPLVFAGLPDRKRLDAANGYVARSARRRGWPALLFSDPLWPADELERRVAAGGFLGLKSYLTMAPGCLPAPEIRIFDFFPHHQLELANRRRWIVMLHIPRDLRLRDPVNLAQLLEIERRYPNLQLIVAHVGRAYCAEDIGDAFKALAKTRLMRFDFSANSNEFVFRRLLECVGPKRVLFGSDMPILRMRARRICENGRYVNLVPKGLYGDVSGDAHLRAVAGAGAGRLTFFMFEELDAFRRAARDVQLAPSDIEAVFYGNAAGMLERAGAAPRAQLEMVYPASRPAPAIPAPRGYALRCLRPGDENRIIRLMRRAGFADWNAATLAGLMKSALPSGVICAIHKRSGCLAAAAGATHNPSERHPAGGELGWVACEPAHRGRGLGAAVCAAAVRRLRAAGYSRIYLRTDDFRLPAIRVYLKSGWRPLLFAPDMAARWRKVTEQLRTS